MKGEWEDRGRESEGGWGGWDGGWGKKVGGGGVGGGGLKSKELSGEKVDSSLILILVVLQTLKVLHEHARVSGKGRNLKNTK